jgi:hypothetical protein
MPKEEQRYMLSKKIITSLGKSNATKMVEAT